TARSEGIYALASATVSNTGTIVSGNAGYAINLLGGGSLSIGASGVVTAGLETAIFLGGAVAGAIINDGSVEGGASGYAVVLAHGGTLKNTGTIHALARNAVLLESAGTVDNYGVINGRQVSLTAGGLVNNHSGATIADGVYFNSSNAGTVIDA